MTLVEFILSVSSLHETGLTALALYMTVLSGYMVVAYSVGSDLNKSQIVIINAIFLVFSLALSLASYFYFRGAYELGLAHWPDSSPRSEAIILRLFLFAQIAAILGGLKFMFDIRKKLPADTAEVGE